MRFIQLFVFGLPVLFCGCASKPVKVSNTVSLNSVLSSSGDSGLLQHDLAASASGSEAPAGVPSGVSEPAAVFQPAGKERVYYFPEQVDGEVRTGPSREYVLNKSGGMEAAYDPRESLERARAYASGELVTEAPSDGGVMRRRSWMDVSGRMMESVDGPAFGEGFDNRIYRRLSPSKERVFYFPAMVEEGKLVPPSRMYVRTVDEGYAVPPVDSALDAPRVAAPLSQLEDPRVFGSGTNPLNGSRVGGFGSLFRGGSGTQEGSTSDALVPSGVVNANGERPLVPVGKRPLFAGSAVVHEEDVPPAHRSLASATSSAGVAAKPLPGVREVDSGRGLGRMPDFVPDGSGGAGSRDSALEFSWDPKPQSEPGRRDSQVAPGDVRVDAVWVTHVLGGLGGPLVEGWFFPFNVPGYDDLGRRRAENMLERSPDAPPLGPDCLLVYKTEYGGWGLFWFPKAR
jgi:hypothetical protein